MTKGEGRQKSQKIWWRLLWTTAPYVVVVTYLRVLLSESLMTISMLDSRRKTIRESVVFDEQTLAVLLHSSATVVRFQIFFTDSESWQNYKDVNNSPGL